MFSNSKRYWKKKEDCYVVLGLRGRELREATVPWVLFTRGREGRERRAPREANNLIVASFLIITDTGFSFIEMTDLTPKKIS